MVTKTPDHVLKKIEGIVRNVVKERATDGLVFDPILVVSHPDTWDEERVFMYIVYDGDPDQLDPGWTMGFVDMVLQRTTEEELPIVPFKHFVHKSEWPEFYRYNVEPWFPATY